MSIKFIPSDKDPKMFLVYCIFCVHSWAAFCPDGLNENTRLECPKCHKMGGTGMITEETPTR